MASLLILEDLEDCIDMLEDILAPEHQLTVVRDLASFSRAIQNGESYDLLLADLKLPDGNFLDWVMKDHPGYMVEQNTIIVSSVADLDVLTGCFEWGAVDYLIKPFRDVELKAKVGRALGQFTLKAPAGPDELQQILEALTSIEAKIFQHFVKSPEVIVTREKIMMAVWKKVSVNAKTLDVHLSNIRKKIKDTNWTIEFRDGEGWRLTRKTR